MPHIAAEGEFMSDYCIFDSLEQCFYDCPNCIRCEDFEVDEDKFHEEWAEERCFHSDVIKNLKNY